MAGRPALIQVKAQQTRLVRRENPDAGALHPDDLGQDLGEPPGLRGRVFRSILLGPGHVH